MATTQPNDDVKIDPGKVSEARYGELMMGKDQNDKAQFVAVDENGKLQTEITVDNVDINIGKVGLLDENQNDINVQTPLPTDGDSVYVKDLDMVYSNNGNFSGSVTDYFDSLKTVNIDITANDPKIIKLWFKRTIYASAIGLGCDDITKNFGNSITIELLGSGDVVRETINSNSGDSNSRLIEFKPSAFNGINIKFNTNNNVNLSNITISKEVQVSARLKALKPDGTVTNVDATAGGNLKFSLEEFDGAFNTNPLPVKEWEIGVPGTFTKIGENTLKHNILKGQLNKPSIRTRIGNEHVESSRQIQSVVTATNIVTQHFKASKDNISGTYLTLESAAGINIDNFESYANNAALQLAWPVTGINLATLETTIIKGGTQSMALLGDVLNDTWTKTFLATDYTGYNIELDAQFTKDFAKFQVTAFISDGINISTFLLTFNAKDVWNHYSIPILAFVGLANITAITQVGFIITLANGGEIAYVDNIRVVPPPGKIEAKLWDMGPTEPVDGVTKISDGTQYVKLDGNLSSVLIDLKGGKRMYHLHDSFTAGVNKNEPTNQLLNVGNYYLLELKWVDTDVNVYGPDTTFNKDYYTHGYAATTTDELTPLTRLGPFNDIMFAIQSMQDVYIVEAEWRFDAIPNGDSDLYVFVEDTGMIVTDVVVDHEEQPPQNNEEDVSRRPMFLEDGGKLEFYYNDDFTDNVSKVIISMQYLYEPPNTNG